MAFTYSYLLESKKPTKETFQLIADILNRGYTFDVVREAIIDCFNNQRQFPFDKFNRQVGQNLLHHVTRYYHKELLIRSELKAVAYDIDTGNTTSSENEYWVEPRASYTIEDLLAYFKKNVSYNSTQYSDNRLRGILKECVNRLDLETVLFMIEHAIKMHHSDKVTFDYRRFDDYQTNARQYLEEIKSNVAYSGGTKYVFRKRVLFD